MKMAGDPEFRGLAADLRKGDHVRHLSPSYHGKGVVHAVHPERGIGVTWDVDLGDPVQSWEHPGDLRKIGAIGDTHHLASDSAEMFIAREIPVRDGVIMANRKLANMYELDQSKVHPDWHYNGWDWEHTPTDSRVMLGEDDLGNDYYSFHQGGQHYEGQHDPHAFLSKSPEELLNNFGIEHPGLPEHPSRIKDANVSQRELLAMIDKLADWTKYDDEVDPVVEAYGKSKIPSTKAPRIPRDWSKREPDGTWKGPAIPRKKK